MHTDTHTQSHDPDPPPLGPPPLDLAKFALGSAITGATYAAIFFGFHHISEASGDKNPDDTGLSVPTSLTTERTPPLPNLSGLEDQFKEK